MGVHRVNGKEIKGTAPDTPELKLFKHVKLSKNGLDAVIKFAGVLYREPAFHSMHRARYYWFDRIDNKEWVGGWMKTLENCLGNVYESIYVIDRYNGHTWEVTRKGECHAEKEYSIECTD